jgi:peptidoglycan/LPS O-acetylase OafA/YrhL
VDFTLLRLLLASDVVLAHYRELTGFGQWWSHGFSSTVAVQAFFVISGWIVTASYESSSNVAGFFVRRIARLYPLYAVVVIAQALATFIIMQAPAGSFGEIAHYLATNLSFANFLQPSLLGFLDHARVHAINPALWTLKIEVMFYASVPLLVALTRRYPREGLLAMFAASTAFYYLVEPLSGELAKQLPGQLRFFVAGMICRQLLTKTSYIQDLPKIGCWLLALTGLLAAQFSDGNYALAVFQPVFVALFVVAAVRLSPRFKNDFSFGVYLVHAPVIQFLHQYGVGLLEPGPIGLMMVLLITALLAFAGSYAIEQPAIRWGHRLSQHLSARRNARFKSAVESLHEAK